MDGSLRNLATQVVLLFEQILITVCDWRGKGRHALSCHRAPTT